MADNTPVVPGSDTTSDPKEVKTSEDVTQEKEEIEIPTFAKGVDTSKEEETPEVAPIPPEDSQPEPTEEQATLKKRLSGAISEVEKKNEEVRQLVDLQAEQVTANNDLIHKVAERDPVLANKVVQRVWGTQGIRSYKQLLERSKLEALKESDPKTYNTEKELFEIKSKLATYEEKDQKKTRDKFLESKGIKENEYDPKYKKLTEALESLNPILVQEDYDKALKLAHSIAFSEDREVISEVPEVPTLSMGGGKKMAPLPSSKPAYSDQTTWLANQLNKQRGYKIQL